MSERLIDNVSRKTTLKQQKTSDVSQPFDSFLRCRRRGCSLGGASGVSAVSVGCSVGVDRWIGAATRDNVGISPDERGAEPEGEALGSDRKRSGVQAPKMCFLLMVSGFSLTGADIRLQLGEELVGELLLGSSLMENMQGQHRKHWRDYMSQLTWEPLRAPGRSWKGVCCWMGGTGWMTCLLWC